MSTATLTNTAGGVPRLIATEQITAEIDILLDRLSMLQMLNGHNMAAAQQRGDAEGLEVLTAEAFHLGVLITQIRATTNSYVKHANNA